MTIKKKKIILSVILATAIILAVSLFFYMTRFTEEENQKVMDDLAIELSQYKKITNATETIKIDYISIFQNQLNGYDIREDNSISTYFQNQSLHFDYTIDYIDFWGRKKDRARVVTTLSHADMKYVQDHGISLMEKRITGMESDRGLIIHEIDAFSDILNNDKIPFVYETVTFKVELINDTWKITDESNKKLIQILLGNFKYKFLYDTEYN